MLSMGIALRRPTSLLNHYPKVALVPGRRHCLRGTHVSVEDVRFYEKQYLKTDHRYRHRKIPKEQEAAICLNLSKLVKELASKYATAFDN